MMKIMCMISERNGRSVDANHVVVFITRPRNSIRSR
jgi:hypothetical protein